jgi:two-component system NtrC family sensor kinase
VDVSRKPDRTGVACPEDVSLKGQGPRVLLLAISAATAAATAVLLLAVGLPLLAVHRLDSPRFVGLVALAALTVLGVGTLFLGRLVGRPLDRLLSAARRLGGAGLSAEFPPLGDGGAGLSRVAVAFERVTLSLVEERVRLSEKVEELTTANRALAEARQSLMRSERLATVGTLASGLAHEVGNPLGAISGYAEVARSRVPADASPDLLDALDRIAAAAGRIDRTVRDLLDFARPSTPTLREIDLAGPIEAALRLAQGQPRFRDVEVTLDAPTGLPRVNADEHQLSQVFLNLFLNAGDAMDGQGAITVRARVEGHHVRVEVEDSGPGIPADDLPRVFDPFFTTKSPGAGTGLGLAVCHAIMEATGGDIAASRGQDGGALFTLRIPGTREARAP